jgi:hypothetical protein
MMARVAVWSVAFVLSCAAAAQAVEAIWIGPEVGAWNVAANWSTGAIPNFPSAARIDDDPGQNSRVESRSPALVGLLTIDAGDMLAVINSQFNVGRPLLLDGTISIEGSGQVSGGLTLKPGSEIRLNASGATAAIPGLFNAGDIHGGGRIYFTSGTTSLTSYNQSTIRADNPTIPLTLQLSNNANFENNGRLIATGGGRLQITRGSTFGDPFGIIGGRIEAHPGSTVSMQAYTYVEDAVLALIEDEDPLTSAPSFQFVNAELKDVTLEGSFKLSGATIVGSLRNLGEMTQGTSSHIENDLDGEVLLTGSGTVNLQSQTPALFTGTEGADRLINVDNVIRGRGELLVSWVGFTNRNVVQADAGNNAELQFYNGLSKELLVNSGIMKAINGGRLRLAGYSRAAMMENFEGSEGGKIIAGENSSVLLSLIHIKGGTLRAEGDNPATRGKFLAEPLVVLEDVTAEGHFRFQTAAGQLSQITVNERLTNNGSMTARFAFGLNAELMGGGEIVGEAGSFFSLGQLASVVNTDNFIHGSGSISSNFTNSRFTNRGTLRSDGLMTISSTLQIVNRGRLEAGPGAQLDLPSTDTVINYEDGVEGVIQAADGGVVNFSRIDGGILSTEGSGVIRSRSNGFIKDVHNKGTLEVNSITAQGNIVNDGVIKGSLRLSSPMVRFVGTGMWDANASTVEGGVLINGPAHTILGSGNLAASASPVSVVVNEGALRAKEGPVFNISALSFGNSGLVHAPTERTLSISSSLGRVENSGTLQVDGNMGFHAPAGLYNSEEGVIDVRGRLTLEETVLRNRPSGVIIGSGEITGAILTGPLVLNEGVIEPGAGFATIRIGDDFQQLASGRLRMEISGGANRSSDLLAVDGNASLAGTLQVSLVGDEPLVPGDSYTLLTASGGMVGTFSELAMPTLGDELFWYVQYLRSGLHATVAEEIPGDFNRNGSVGADDYVLWRKNGGQQSEYDDWAAHFGQNVNLAEPLSQGEVPEPTSGFMSLWCAALILALRQRGAVRFA